MKKTGLLLCLCALTYISGAHLALVQGIAWSRMVVDYSRTAGLVTGISETFDGDHPCSSCKEVSKAKKDQNPQQLQLKLSELKAPTISGNTMLLQRLPAGLPSYFPIGSLSCGIGQQAPPSPPPQV